MRRTRACWLLAVMGVASVVLPGCVTTGPSGVGCPMPPPMAFDIPACCRNRVFFFLVGDFHPATISKVCAASCSRRVISRCTAAIA